MYKVFLLIEGLKPLMEGFAFFDFYRILPVPYFLYIQQFPDQEVCPDSLS